MGKIIFTDMLLDRLALLIRPTTRFYGFEGPARSAKTGLAIQGFYYRMYASEDMLGCIAGRNLDSILNNILKEPTIGLLTTHPELMMVKDKVGSYYIEMPTPKGIKKILLAGYSDSSKWKNILGGNIAVFLIDEANIADKNFVNETFARQLACINPLTIFTTNGDNPDHFIYQEFMNYGKVIGQVPSTTRALIEQFQATKGKKDGYYYSHFKMSDNPVMTPDKLERAQSIYPIGSYYHKTKILGERGVQGSLIFNDYMDPQKLIIDVYEKDQYGRPKYNFTRYTIGADIGESKAYNVFVLIGWLKGYKKCVILKHMSFLKLGYNTKREKLKDFVRLCIASGINVNLIDGIAVDSAEGNFIADLRPVFLQEFRLDVFGSWKATIKMRIDMNIVGFSTSRVLFDRSCEKIYAAYYTSTWEEGHIGEIRLDSGIEVNDLMDATEYAQTRHMDELMEEGD
jgi:hypothetical protein